MTYKEAVKACADTAETLDKAVRLLNVTGFCEESETFWSVVGEAYKRAGEATGVLEQIMRAGRR